MKTKKGKKHKEAHVMDTKYGMGDYYGTGFKAPIGRMRDSSYPGQMPVNKKQLKTPPKSVV
jgi:hypothetical protein